MKKKLAIIVIAIIIVVALVAGGIFASQFIREWKKDSDRINNSKTLSQYVQYHSSEYVGDNMPMWFYAQDIKWDLLKDKKILYYGDGFLVLDDYTIYETSFTSDKTYSNGQHCKKIDIDIEIERIQLINHTLYFISKDNRYYTFNLSDKTLMESKQFSLSKILLEDETIIKYVSTQSQSDAYTSQDNYIALKNDGKLYEYQFDGSYNSTTGEWKYNLSQKQLLANQDYGHVTDFVYSKDLWNIVSTQDIVLDDERIILVIADESLHYLKKISDKQYIDSEATYELVSSEIYSKYKKDIRFINSRYVFTTDNNIIQTNMLCTDIDKEVK